MPVQLKKGLTGNQLKIIAMLAMTCDHVGLQLFPRIALLRHIGRLALPVYAYMIAEGCRHTRDRKRYLLRLALLALLCQAVYFVAMGSLYQCILVTFFLSVCLIYLVDDIGTDSGKRLRFFAMCAVVFLLCVVLPDCLPGTDFAIDYGLMGVLLPVLGYVAGVRGMTVGLILLALDCGGRQWLALAAVPLLMLYNGQRGTLKIGRLFYWYYPVHLVVIYGLSLIL